MASADSLTLGELQQFGEYCFAWRVQGVLDRHEHHLHSPGFVSNGFTFNLTHDTRLRATQSISLFLHTHVTSSKAFPIADFCLGVRCIDKSLPDSSSAVYVKLQSGAYGERQRIHSQPKHVSAGSMVCVTAWMD